MKPAAVRVAPLAAVVVVLTLVRLAMAASVPLAPDEAYYWIWSRALAAGYLDHPPMVALWIRMGTLLAGDTPIGVRLLGPLSMAAGSWLLADGAERLLPGRQAGLVAAALFNATLLAGVGSVIMTPDTPLLLFWTATLWALARFVSGQDGRWFLAAGAFAGLALCSKYTAAFLWPGIALWLLWVPALRPWLRRPAPWLGAVLGLALFLPVVAWNRQHDWAGFLRQGGRVADWHAARAVQFLGELVGGQIGLATPLVFLLCAAGLAVAWQRAWRDPDPALTLLTALSLPPVLVFMQHGFGDRVQGNWPAIIYPAAVIAAAALNTPRWVRLRGPALGLGFAITALVYLQAATGLLPIPASIDPIVRQLAGWRGLAEQVEAARRQAGAAFVVADQYALASELAWTLPPRIVVVGLDPRWALTSLPPARLQGLTGLLVQPARSGNPVAWRGARPLGTISRGADRYALFQMEAGAEQAAAVDLPRP